MLRRFLAAVNGRLDMAARAAQYAPINPEGRT